MRNIGLKYQEKGITLVALVVTIIVLLILASVTINIVLSENGILSRAKQVTEVSEMSQEKDIIAMAYGEAVIEKKDSTISGDDLDSKLVGYEAYASGNNPITVVFNNSKRRYTINRDGVIEYVGLASISSIYATVCVDGTNQTLLFSNNEQSIQKYLEDNNTTLANRYTVEDISNSNYNIGGTPATSVLPQWFQNPRITKAIILNPISPTNTVAWFLYLSNLTTIENISNIYTGNVTNMSGMFYGCSNLTELDLSSFDTTHVTDMRGMFCECNNLTNLNISNFNTKNVIDMNNMFCYCSSLTSLNLQNFNTEKVTNMSEMFAECSNLININLGSFNTSRVTEINSMFYKCGALTTIDISTFNTRNIEKMNTMFYKCQNLTTIYTLNDFDTTSVTNSSSMFEGCPNLVGGSGTAYSEENIDATMAHIDGGTPNPGYFTLKNN